jgi:outer membrane protein OmpA-like peptidoglycan-associated protein
MKAFTTVCILFFTVLVMGQALPDSYHIKSIFFGGGSDYIDPGQKQELLDWIDGFPNLQEYDIIIHSHTDNIGSIEYNNWLSRLRSESVYQLLKSHNIPEDWMQIRDFGEFNPDYNNENFYGRIRNRRVDVILVPPSS